MKRIVTTAVVLMMATGFPAAQGQRPASPEGTTATQVGPKFGKWIEIRYGRPILRGRADIFGSGPDYGKQILAGAPIWRAGANVTTRIHTEVPLVIGGRTVPPGEYSVFIDAKTPTDWTFVLSSHGALTNPKEPTPDAIWGAYGYTPGKDVARAAMKVDGLPYAIDQLTWGFTDMTEKGGTLRIWWSNTTAAIPFTVGS